MADDGSQFGRVPTQIVADGWLARFTPAVQAVYFCVCAFDRADWSSRIGMRKMAALLGLHISTVHNAIHQLADAGLIQVTTGRNGTGSTYHIIPNRSDVPERSDADNRSGGRERSKPEPFGLTGETVRIERSNRSGGRERYREVRESQSVASDSEMHFPTKAGDDWPLPADRLAEYRRAFPGIDIDHELAKARLWLLDNPGRRKTAKGMPRFLSGWLTRAKPTPTGPAVDANGCAAIDADPVTPPDEVFYP